MYTVLLAEDAPDLTASVMQEKRMHDDSDDLSFPAALFINGITIGAVKG